MLPKYIVEPPRSKVCAATGRWPCVCVEDRNHRPFPHRCACGVAWRYQGKVGELVDEEVQTDPHMVTIVYAMLLGAIEGPHE